MQPTQTESPLLQPCPQKRHRLHALVDHDRPASSLLLAHKDEFIHRHGSAPAATEERSVKGSPFDPSILDLSHSLKALKSSLGSQVDNGEEFN